MKKRRDENTSLPKRWRWKHGAIYYRVPAGTEDQWDGKKEFRLGRDMVEAFQTWAERVTDRELDVHRFDKLTERYRMEHIPTLSVRARQQYMDCTNTLVAVFGEMLVSEIRAVHCYELHDRLKRARSPWVARIHVAVLKNMLSCALQWGVIEHHPLYGLRFAKPPGRKRYVEHWEVREMLSIQSQYRGVQMLQQYIRLKLMTGFRRSDLLRLTINDVAGSHLEVTPHKTEDTSGITLRVRITPEMRKVLTAISSMKPARIGNAPLFCTRSGKPMIDDEGMCSGFDSMWQRFVAKCLAETRIEVRFQEKDLRAKVGSDEKDSQSAKERLGHTNQQTTDRHYRRAATELDPVDINWSAIDDGE